MRKLLLLTVAATVLAVPAAAPAAGWNCSAGALLGQPTGAPVSANVGAATCKAASAGGNLPALPVPLQASVISARTTLDGPADQPAQQTAGATGAVAGLTLDVPADAPIPIPATAVPVPGVGDVDITQALRSLVPAAAGPLLGVKLSSATASGRCAGGGPELSGSSHVLGLTIAGQELPVDDAVTQAVALAGTLDLSQLSASALPAPLNTLPANELQSLLDQLPAVPFSAPVQIKVTPGSQSRGDGTLTQKGLQVFAAIAGQTIFDLTLGQATISQDDVSCGQPVAAAQLACTRRRLALIDVLERKGYARLYGAADRRYIGRRVSLVASWSGKVVARPRIRRDGTFTAKGKLPPRALRHTNRALPGADRQGEVVAPQALPADARHADDKRQGQGEDRGAHRAPARASGTDDHDQAPRLVHEERRRQETSPGLEGALLGHARCAAERAGSGLQAGHEGAQEYA
jgi:hypothetical protein